MMENSCRSLVQDHSIFNKTLNKFSQYKSKQNLLGFGVQEQNEQDKIQIVQFLQENELFSILSFRMQKIISKFSQIIEKIEHDYLFKENAENKYMYWIIEGDFIIKKSLRLFAKSEQKLFRADSQQINSPQEKNELFKQQQMRKNIYSSSQGNIKSNQISQIQNQDSDSESDQDKVWKDYLIEKKFYRNCELIQVSRQDFLGEIDIFKVEDNLQMLDKNRQQSNSKTKKISLQQQQYQKRIEQEQEEMVIKIKNKYSVQCVSEKSKVVQIPLKILNEVIQRSQKFRNNLKKLLETRNLKLEELTLQQKEMLTNSSKHEFLAPKIRSPRIGINPMVGLQRQLNEIFQKKEKKLAQSQSQQKQKNLSFLMNGIQTKVRSISLEQYQQNQQEIKPSFISYTNNQVKTVEVKKRKYLDKIQEEQNQEQIYVMKYQNKSQQQYSSHKSPYSSPKSFQHSQFYYQSQNQSVQQQKGFDISQIPLKYECKVDEKIMLKKRAHQISQYVQNQKQNSQSKYHSQQTENFNENEQDSLIENALQYRVKSLSQEKSLNKRELNITYKEMSRQVFYQLGINDPLFGQCETLQKYLTFQRQIQPLKHTVKDWRTNINNFKNAKSLKEIQQQLQTPNKNLSKQQSPKGIQSENYRKQQTNLNLNQNKTIQMIKSKQQKNPHHYFQQIFKNIETNKIPKFNNKSLEFLQNQNKILKSPGRPQNLDSASSFRQYQFQVQNK